MAKIKKTNKQDPKVKLLLKTLESLLKTFKTSKVFDRRYHDKIDEDGLTSILRFHLEQQCCLSDLPFTFESQAQQGNGRKPDIGVQLKARDKEEDGDYIFFIEAKWTNAHDYVYSNTGAIKRFKNIDHGIDNPNPNHVNKPVKESAIVGYDKLKKQNFEKTQEKINIEINNLVSSGVCEFGLTWDNTELLRSIIQGNFDNHISHHQRKDGIPITLYHFWIKIK